MGWQSWGGVCSFRSRKIVCLCDELLCWRAKTKAVPSSCSMAQVVCLQVISPRHRGSMLPRSRVARPNRSVCAPVVNSISSRMLMPPINIANIARVTTSRAALVAALLLGGCRMSVGLAAAAAAGVLVLWDGSWSVPCFLLASVEEEPGLERLFKPPIELQSVSNSRDPNSQLTRHTWTPIGAGWWHMQDL